MANIAEMQEQGMALDLDTGKWVTAGEFTNDPNGGLDPIPAKETPEETAKPETEAKKDDSQGFAVYSRYRDWETDRKSVV